MGYALTITRDGAERIDALVPFAAKASDGRPVLATVAFGPERVYATDSHALGIVEVDGVEVSWETDAPGTVPMVDARDLRKSLKDVRPDARGPAALATVTFDERTATLEGGGRTVTLPLVEGTFPAMDKVVGGWRDPAEGGPMPAVSAELLGRFARLVQATKPRGSKGPSTSGIALVPAEGLGPVQVQVDGLVVGLIMPIRGIGSVAEARAAAAEAAADAAAAA